MSALRRVAPLAGLLAAELAAVGLLHALGQQPWARVPVGEPARWVDATPPVEALMAALRLVGLGVGWWLLVTTATTAAATLVRAERLAGLVRPMTWAVARRAADRAVAAGLSVALLAPGGPAMADATDSPPPPALSEPADVEPTPSNERADVEPTPNDERADVEPTPNDERADDERADDGPADDERAGSRDSRGDAERRTPRERGEKSRMHEIAAGEHLWGIAAEALAAHRGVSPDELADREVAVHWREVVEANDGRLRSGDPDLVYPGEQLRLPPPPA